MNPELLGMSNEELIQWACKYGCVEERRLRVAFPGIEAHCAIHLISLGKFIALIVDLTLCGMSLRHSVKLIKDTGDACY